MELERAQAARRSRLALLKKAQVEQENLPALEIVQVELERAQPELERAQAVEQEHLPALEVVVQVELERAQAELGNQLPLRQAAQEVGERRDHRALLLESLFLKPLQAERQFLEVERGAQQADRHVVDLLLHAVALLLLDQKGEKRHLAGRNQRINPC